MKNYTKIRVKFTHFHMMTSKLVKLPNPFYLLHAHHFQLYKSIKLRIEIKEPVGEHFNL